MFQNSVCSNIAEFYAFLKKIKNANTGHYVRHVWKNTSFLFYAFFLTCFVFFAADFMEVGSSEVKSGGRLGGLVPLNFATCTCLKMKIKIYH